MTGQPTLEQLEAIAAQAIDVISQYSPPLPMEEQALEDALVEAGLWDPDDGQVTRAGQALLGRWADTTGASLTK